MSGPTPSPPSNRRGSRRISPKRRIKVACRNALDLGPNVATALLDLSETGVRLKLSRSFEKDENVTITLESPALVRTISRVGRVVWCYPAENDEFYVGVYFDKRLPYAEFSTLTGL